MPTSHAQGMARQLETMDARCRQGMPRTGWKIGLNVPEVQRRAGLTGPLIGFLNGDRVLTSGAKVVCPANARLSLEPELCVTVAHDVSRDVSLDEARTAIASVRPAFEIVDYSLPMHNLDEIVAHSMFHHGIVLGEARALPAVDALAAIPKILEFHVGDKSAAARGDLVPADLAVLVQKMAQLLAEVGQQLRAGDLIMSGAFVDKALPLVPGAQAWARFGVLGDVRCEGVAEPSQPAT